MDKERKDTVAMDTRRVGYWPLREDFKDASSNERHGKGESVLFQDGAAVFDGENSQVLLPDAEITTGTRPFTLSMEFKIDDKNGTLPGVLASRYVPDRMEGWHLTPMTQTGGPSCISNWRHLQFGWSLPITEDLIPKWQDRGAPGNSRMICALCTYQGSLYAGVFDDAKDNKGHVYRLDENNEWIDCGNPDDSNSVWTLTEYKGKLYAGTMKYNAKGSSLPESPNMSVPGGKIYRYEGGKTWSFFGEIPGSDSCAALVPYQGKLVAMSFYTPGVVAFDEDGTMQDLGAPGPEKNIRGMNLGIYRGRLYIGCNWMEGVYSRTLDEDWVYEGTVDKCDQVYVFTVHHNSLLMGIWREARVVRYEGNRVWSDYGLMGSEMEVMGISLYNGKLYGGTLPGGHVYRYSGETEWILSGVLEQPDPNIRYRRVWSMAVHNGELYAGTLPGGKVWSLNNGPIATYDYSLEDGWHKTAIVYDRQALSLYLDGKLVSKEPIDPSKISDLSQASLVIGNGPQARFSGSIREVELFDAALSEEEIARLFKKR
jgi:hypothetical protein